MTKPPLDEADRPRPWPVRLGWFVAIWAASVGALAMVAWLLRLWLK